MIWFNATGFIFLRIHTFKMHRHVYVGSVVAGSSRFVSSNDADKHQTSLRERKQRDLLLWSSAGTH